MHQASTSSVKKACTEDIRVDMTTTSTTELLGHTDPLESLGIQLLVTRKPAARRGTGLRISSRALDEIIGESSSLHLTKAEVDEQASRWERGLLQDDKRRVEVLAHSLRDSKPDLRH